MIGQEQQNLISTRFSLKNISSSMVIIGGHSTLG
jgi:hypothetical protein